jgi:hypothetical protein
VKLTILEIPKQKSKSLFGFGKNKHYGNILIKSQAFSKIASCFDMKLHEFE